MGQLGKGLWSFLWAYGSVSELKFSFVFKMKKYSHGHLREYVHL